MLIYDNGITREMTETEVSEAEARCAIFQAAREAEADYDEIMEALNILMPEVESE